MAYDLPEFSFSARISGASSEGRIDRNDGQSVLISQADLPDLLLDLAAEGSGLLGRPRHHHRVLCEWFSRKSGRPAGRPQLVAL